MKKKLFFVLAVCAVGATAALTSCEGSGPGGSCVCDVTEPYSGVTIQQVIEPASIGGASCSDVTRIMNAAAEGTLTYKCK